MDEQRQQQIMVQLPDELKDHIISYLPKSLASTIMEEKLKDNTVHSEIPNLRKYVREWVDTITFWGPEDFTEQYVRVLRKLICVNRRKIRKHIIEEKRRKKSQTKLPSHG